MRKNRKFIMVDDNTFSLKTKLSTKRGKDVIEIPEYINDMFDIGEGQELQVTVTVLDNDEIVEPTTNEE